MILDLGCGYDKSRYEKGALTVDIDARAEPDVVHDLDKYPYPFEDGSIDKIMISHCLEHLEDPVRFLEESYRLLKFGGILVIRVPHFSSATSFNSLVHKHSFGVTTFLSQYSDHYMFVQKSVKLNYCAYRTTWKRKLLNVLPSFLANLNPRYCERLWCYWVGGFSEIEYVLMKV